MVSFSWTIYQAMMMKHFQQAWREHRTDARSAEEFFGFDARNVKAVHFHLDGAGDGYWFRLKDGRVFDREARLAPWNPRFYDAGWSAEEEIPTAEVRRNLALMVKALGKLGLAGILYRLKIGRAIDRHEAPPEPDRWYYDTPS